MRHYDKSNWKKVRLGDLCSITTGKLDANAMCSYGKYAFFTCAKEVYKIDKYAFDTEALLISGNGSHVGYVHYYKGKFNAYQRTYVLDNFHDNILFIKYFLDSKLAQRIDTEKKSGNTPYILRDTLCDMEIFKPNTDQEQLQIVKTLEQIDNSISNLEKLISKQESIKKTTLKLLLEPKSDYNTVTLGDIVVLAKGEQLGKSQMDPSGEYMVMNGGITASGKTNKYNHLGNTITISEGGNSCGFVSFIKDNFWCGGHCYTLENLKVDTDYLYQLLKYREDSIMKLRVGSGLPNIPKNRLASLILSVINSKEHQKRIAAQLSEIDAHIENLKQQLAKQRAIKQGLMDYFFGN